MKSLNLEKYYIWGTGYRAEQINQYYAEQLNDINIIGYIDNNPAKWKDYFFGKKIYSPEILIEDKDAYIIIITKFSQEIVKQIIEQYPWYKERIVENENNIFFKRLQILFRYEDSEEKEIQDIVKYLKYHQLQLFNYPFVEKYNTEDSHIEYDQDKKLYYALYCDKKMYFPRSFQDEKSVREYFRLVCIHQDTDSPHRYLTDKFNVPDNAVVVDGGVAEGDFALSIIDRVKKIYLFEPDGEWVKALKHTFEPYKEKIVIINKCLSNYIKGDTTTLDEILDGSNVDFIKMDIEGEEYYAMQGALKSITATENLRVVVCTYHQEFAYDAIKKLLEDLHFKTETSTGYIWCPASFNPMRPPVLRKCLIRAEKNSNKSIN
ncbi:FkbM family methyltransferase [Lacrimispora aerotolerans]|uniref:FkbM family methyltransferase n=1 Tax=Lacrimispora aerotolerans TaxID=36832 RepID=UPI00047EE239|nr:FkbM family methyltransferase [Lacrimispora aerotolerans]